MSDSTKRQRIDLTHWRPTDTLRKYIPQPTPGTTPLLNTYYADFYPATSLPLPECQLNERTIRYGYLDTPLVDNEYMSCRDLIYDRLQDKRVLQELQQFAALTFQRQRTRGRLESNKLPVFPSASRKSKTEEWHREWIRQLSNCQVPLSVLANAVPQGMKAEKLLESLQREKVGTYRAMWAIKILGMYEIMGKHPALDHKELLAVGPQYTLQWTKQFIQFLEHTLGTALDNARDWEYCQSLLHQQYAQGVLDQRHTVSWMTNQLKTLSVDKQMVLLPLIVEYTEEIAKSRTPLRKLIGAVVYAVEQTTKYESLAGFNGKLRRYLRMLFDRYPDAFVEPTTWKTYKRTLGDHTMGVEERNARFGCFDDHLRSVVEIRKTQSTVLDQLQRPDYAEAPKETGSILRVCEWAAEDSLSKWMSQYRFQAAASLCRQYRRDTVQREVMEFLDTYRTENTSGVCGLLETLCQAGCFSIPQYLEVLTARGDFFGSTIETSRSQRHLQYVLDMPIGMEGGEQRRRMLLYDCQMSPNEEVRELRELLTQHMPFMVAYTCGTLVRAARNQQPGSISQQVVDWWMADRVELPTASQLSKTQLASAKAQTQCLKDWISPLLDNIQDEEALGKWPDRLAGMLANSSRHLVDLVVNQRLMPMVYDYVVKDVKVGEDNWRVITKPGTSLLNKRQTASVVRVLVDAQLFGTLLEFLLWMLSHSTLPDVVALAHHMLRRYRSAWRRMGRLDQQTVDRVESAYRGNETAWLVYEYLRTAQCWEAQSLVDMLQRDYSQHTNTHVSELLMQDSGSDNHSLNVRKDILALSQQLVRDRMSSGTVEELEWNVVPCFQRIGQWAFTKCQQQQQRNADIPFSIAGQETKLRRMFEMVAGEVTQTVGQAPRDMVRWVAETSARFVRWFAVNSGLPKEYTGKELLSALTNMLKEYAGDQQTLMVGMETWVGRLVAYGCLRLDELVPWLIERCRGSPSMNESAGLAGIVGMPLEETGQVYERLEIGACWAMTLEDNRQLRIQTIEAIFLCASVAGHLRAQNAGQLAQLMGDKTTGLAQSEWIQQLVVDQIPFSQQDMELAHNIPVWQCYYTMLEIYRANIEAQIRDPQLPLAVKRSVLRTLMTLCEGRDPEADGFVGMTRSEVSHRLRETVRRFWQGSGEVAKTATLMNALLLFAETALKEETETLEEEDDVVGLLSNCVLEVIASGGSTKRSKGLAEALATLPMEVLEGLVEKGLSMLKTQEIEQEDGLVCLVQRLMAKLAVSDNMERPQEIANDILGQLQSICWQINPHPSSLLSIPTSSLSVDTSQLPTAVYWRIQVAQSLCQLMRNHPDEFMVGEWLRTIVCLCLSDVLSQRKQLYQYMLDFAAITSESMTANQRKSTLECLRSVQPLLYSTTAKKDMQTLGRLFPFDTTTRMTQGTDITGCPWTWIEALEFMPLAPLNKSTQLTATALESMTAFTLRGMVQRETSGRMAGGRLQYLENPYFPLQPVFGFPLAETPLPWQMFGGKRRRLDGESRLVWKYHCQAAFNEL